MNHPLILSLVLRMPLGRKVVHFKPLPTVFPLCLSIVIGVGIVNVPKLW